jgi:mannobiose 2-epimerase
MRTALTIFKQELRRELANILDYWIRFAVDEQGGGFFGKIDNDNRADSTAPKGLVLQARILWAFSAAYLYDNRKEYWEMATRAWHYITDHFHDKNHGGFFWSVNSSGQVIEDKKQIYGIAFCIYGFAEYYKVSRNEAALKLAIDAYFLLERFSLDKKKGGYAEAFTRNWQPLADLRLSVKDANESKTMNTHLHVLEAYTNLYNTWKDDRVKASITGLLENFADHIIDHRTGHLHLFFDEDWQVKGEVISWGHDIEAAWLLCEAAEAVGNTVLTDKVRPLSLKLAAGAMEGIDDADGGLWYEKESGTLVAQKHSWPQAEAMVGFFNAWQLSGDENYLEHVLNSWQFIRNYIIDKEKGEWFWGVNADHSVMSGRDKAGFWKCPYHNSRACLEIIKRIG